MAPQDPRGLGPGVREVIGDDELVEIGQDGSIALLRPARAGRALLVLHQRPPAAAILDEADRLSWLGARGPAPAVIAAGRADDGDEALVLRVGADATAATQGHPMGPEAMIRALAGALRELHALPVERCPLATGIDELREIVHRRLAAAEIAVAVDGPYAGRPPAELSTLFDRLIAEVGPPRSVVFVHGRLAAHRVWLDPSGEVAFTGWSAGGAGDRHLDLAGAAEIATSLYGPALVAPLFDAYGLDEVELRRLDAHQLLAHLLR